MAIKAGQILHAMNQFVVDRIQTGGPGNLNIPEERIYELGNYNSVAVVRDVPDLSFTLDCLDVDTEIEGLLLGSANPSSDTFGTDGLTGTKYALADSTVMDIVSPWKAGRQATDQYRIVRGVAVPHLTLESASYRYGLRDNAGEQFTLRGDSIFYVPGTPRQGVYTGDGTTTTFSFRHGTAGGNETALAYEEQGNTHYALNVSVDGERRRAGEDYTETNTGVTFTTAPANGTTVRIVYGTATNDTTNYTDTAHEGTAVKPAAIKGKDIKVYVGTDGSSPAAPLFWSDIQSVTADYRVTLEDDYEFGNPRAISRDYAGVPDVTGTIEIKPQTVESLFTKLEQVTGVPAGQVIGPQSSTLLPVEIRLLNPDSGGTTARATGTTLKTLYIPDARFTIPGYEGRANQKLVQTMNFSSDGGILEVFKGRRF